ncbi:hypothetical protein FACS1894125_2320 [Actinomycetota bacterium]|nr:hypothetical protein FACS1894125_2320 [Actinomycetota bacterium]
MRLSGLRLRAIRLLLSVYSSFEGLLFSIVDDTSGKLAKALEYDKEIEDLHIQCIPRANLQARDLYLLGYIFEANKKYPQAVEYFKESLEVFDCLEETQEVVLNYNRCLWELGRTCSLSGDEFESEEYYKLARKYCEEWGVRHYLEFYKSHGGQDNEV